MNILTGELEKTDFCPVVDFTEMHRIYNYEKSLDVDNELPEFEKWFENLLRYGFIETLTYNSTLYPKYRIKEKYNFYSIKPELEDNPFLPVVSRQEVQRLFRMRYPSSDGRSKKWIDEQIQSGCIVSLENGKYGIVDMEYYYSPKSY